MNEGFGPLVRPAEGAYVRRHEIKLGSLTIRAIGVSLVLGAVVLLTAAQLTIKSRLNSHGPIPMSGTEGWHYFLAATQDARLMGGFLLLAVAAFGWYAGLSRVPLSVAFPVAALSYPLMFLGATVILREDYSWPGLMGNCLIVIGVIVASSAQ